MKHVDHKTFRAHIDKYHDLTMVIHDEGYMVAIQYNSHNALVAVVMYSQFTNPEYVIGE